MSEKDPLKSLLQAMSPPPIFVPRKPAGPESTSDEKMKTGAALVVYKLFQGKVAF